MAFETSVSLKDCKYTYSLHPNVKNIPYVTIHSLLQSWKLRVKSFARSRSK